MATIFLTLGAPFHRQDGRLFIERQTISGLRAWRDHFDRVIACAITRDAPPPDDHDDAAREGIAPPGFELIGLPDGYHLPTFLRSRRAVGARMLGAMRQADYVAFAIGGWLGDWGVTGARLARRHGIPHAVWFDRVESQVLAAAGGGGLKDRLKAGIRSGLTARNERRVLAGADLALLHGRTVHGHLARFSRNPHLVEDVHLEETDRIAPGGLAAKIAAAAGGPLRLVYAGRAHEMKGGLDWIETLGLLAGAGVAFRADWAGDGPQLAAMRARAAALGIAERITFHGFVADRARVLDLLRGAHLLLFCHLTDESPRILIEALHAATPLAGFADAYAGALAAEQGAGVLVPRGDIRALAGELAALDADRARLADLIGRAGRSARHLTRSSVFAHRSRIIKDNLGPLGRVA